MINLNPKLQLVESKATVIAYDIQVTRNIYSYRGELLSNFNGEKISVEKKGDVYYRTGVSVIDCVKYVHAGPDVFEITVLGRTKHFNLPFNEVKTILESERDSLLAVGPIPYIPDPWIDYIAGKSK
ncbi:hypothetical protein NVP2275O_134 [Vibrio phage 2.275.O._10N.286.54.E11]|nr:hypothetical protein NVP2275O_134 [Vibrio phage 2.275.O._10N.286.54.E11]